MLLFRTLKKARNAKNCPTLQLIFSTILVSLIIYLWKLSGCPGFSESYLCRPVSLSFFLDGFPEFNSSFSAASENDFERLVDMKNFTFVMSPARNPCSDSNAILLVLIHSDTINFEKRWTIRNTWGSISDSRYEIFFLLGLPANDTIQNRLDEENESHGDIVQGNFVDAYRNLTYKHVMALKWTRYFCRRVKYLLKTDDDVFVNLPKFLGYVDGDAIPPLPETGLIRCLPEYNSRACRSWRSKWKVTFSEYRFRSYPPFCQGFTILYSSDVVETLYLLAQRAKYFWIDDVFITGILTTAAGITPTPFGRLILPRENLHKVTDENWNVDPYLLGPSNLRSVDIQKLWGKIRLASNSTKMRHRSPAAKIRS